MIETSIHDLEAVTGISRPTSLKWTEGLPHRSGYQGRYFFNLAHVVTKANARWQSNSRALDGPLIGALIDTAREQGHITAEMYAGDDGFATAKGLCARLTDEERDRLFRCQVAYTNALANSAIGTPDMFALIDVLRIKLVLYPEVFEHVFCDRPHHINWAAFAPAHALCNAQYEEFTEEAIAA